MNNFLHIIVNQMKDEIGAIFNGAEPENLSLVKPQQEKVIYSIAIGPGVRVIQGRPLKALTIRRDIVVSLASVLQSRGLNTQADLDAKTDFANDLARLIMNIERNPQIQELDTGLPISYVSDEGVIEEPLENNTISYNIQIKFVTETIEHFLN